MNTFKSFTDIQTAARGIAGSGNPLRLGIISPYEQKVLESAIRAGKDRLAFPQFLGNKRDIEDVARLTKLNLDDCGIIESADPIADALALAVSGKLDILLVGDKAMPDFVSALNKDSSGFIPRGIQATHVSLLTVPGYHKMLFVADGLMVQPLEITQSISIVQNAVTVARKLGVALPKVALLAAVESISPAMPVTMAEAVIAKMADRGQIKNCVIDGPLSFDCAISAAVAQHKGIKNSLVAGDPDIFIGPTLETADGIFKALSLYAKAESAGVVFGGKIPVVTAYEIQSVQDIVNSIALSLLLK
jgi:phosphotransacetylase